MNFEKNYTLKYISSCNMCGEPVDNHKVLGRRLDKSQGFSPKNKIGVTLSVVQCSRCKLIYSNPLPIPHNIQDHYGVLPESYWKESYFTVHKNYLGDLIPKLKKYINFSLPIKSLDIGAGIGQGMIALKKEGFDAYGIEPSEQFYDRAIQNMGVSEEKIQCVMIENAVFPENEFDFITFGAVLEHLYDPNNALEKVLKWLKPGGIIQIKVPSSNWLIGKLINLSYKFRFYDFVGNLSPMHTPYHLYEFNKKSFELNSKINNYEIVDFEYGVCQTMLPTTKLDFILKPIMEKTKTGMEIYVLLRKKHS